MTRFNWKTTVPLSSDHRLEQQKMPNPRLASRYAKSIIDLAVETGQLDVVFSDMQLLSEVCASNRDFVSFIKSPVINADKKEKIFHILFEGRISDLTDRFCKLLIKKGRERYLPEIADAGIRQFRGLRNIRRVKITTAAPMDEALRGDITRKIKSEIPDEHIELQTAVNEALIGGFVLETDNNLFDASVLRDLKDVKKQFMKNLYIRDIR
jgi:F-type H+-transporting ATPase subunit delta